MTIREFLNNVINANINEEMNEMAKERIAMLDKKNASRSAKPSKTSLANEPIKAKIVEYLNGRDYVTSPNIGLALEISTNKASALCRQLVENGTLEVKDVKVKGKGTLKGYKLIGE